MAVQAAITVFKQEMIAQFERRRTTLSMLPAKESMANGLTVTWLVNGSGGDDAVTRGTNGLIPYGQTANTQISATLQEKVAGKRITGFDVFASQGDQTGALKTAVMSIIRREMDREILAELANCTQDFGTASTPLDVSTILGARAALGYNDVPVNEVDNLFAIISHGAFVFMMQSTEFASGDYVNAKPYSDAIDLDLPFRWAGINFVIHNGIAGKQTSSELLYMFHRSALGYAINVGEEQIDADFNREQKYSWANATVYHKAKILQDSGIIKITHDGSAFVTT